MTVALLLTLLGLAGVACGLLVGQSRLFSIYLAAAGGGLLFGISIFWLVPEIASTSGWPAATAMTIAICLLLVFIDEIFLRSHQPSGRTALGPILLAAGVHSFLDGWSVQALESMHVASMTAPIGLALHKIPEGLAIGWIARRSLGSSWKAAAAAAVVELLTIVGAAVEPHASRSGFTAFGSWWTSGVIAVISGSFLFFGLHAVVPNRRRVGVVLVFAATLVLVATFSFVSSGNL